METISGLCRQVRSGEVAAVELVQRALNSVQADPTSRAFISFNPLAMAQAEQADRGGPPEEPKDRPLHGIPISVKDIFDVAGLETTCGSSFYARQREIPQRDSAYVQAWRRTGAIIIGKTHLNEFAYGLTGENPTYGPCLQPRDPARLTGGSSSGAAASVQAGSSLIGLGTDTGGSIRVPAALCGLVGLRHSPSRRNNEGMFPLAPSFDTCGWMQRHLSDLAFVHSALTGRRVPASSLKNVRIGFLDGEWLSSSEAPIRAAMAYLAKELSRYGVTVTSHQARGFEKAPEIFSALQAYEAGRIHQKFLASPELTYDPAIRARLEGGLALPESEYVKQRQAMKMHVAEIDALWQDNDFLLAPACPSEKLLAKEDHTDKRRSLLQITTPFSLAGLPALTFPWGPEETNFGWQLVAPRDQDDRLISLSHSLSAALDGFEE